MSCIINIAQHTGKKVVYQLPGYIVPGVPVTEASDRYRVRKTFSTGKTFYMYITSMVEIELHLRVLLAGTGKTFH